MKSFRSVWAYIGSDNGLVLSRQQAIIWPMMARFTDAYMHHST